MRGITGVWVICVLLFSGIANAQSNPCGKPPELPTKTQSDENIKGQLEGQAKLLSKFLGQAELGGRIETARKNIYQTSDSFFAAQKDAYLAYVFCVLITEDRSLSTAEKVKILQEFKKPLGNSRARETPKSSRNNVRDRFRADSIRTHPRFAAIGDHWYSASASFVLENLSGIGFDAMIRRNATSIGTCVGDEQRSSGLALTRIDPYDQQAVFRYVAPDAKIGVTVVLGGCQAAGFSGGESTDAVVTLVVKVENEEFEVPLNVKGLPVRFGNFH